MPKLEVLKNKKLVLKNVLKRELRDVEIEILNQELEKFSLLIDKLNVQTFGPLVIKNEGIQINGDGKMTADYDLLIQAHDYKQYKGSFEIIDRLEVPYCVYTRFNGLPADIQYAHTKLDLYFYENELESTGEIYSVILEESENHTVVDLFKPVKIL